MIRSDDLSEITKNSTNVKNQWLILKNIWQIKNIKMIEYKCFQNSKRTWNEDDQYKDMNLSKHPEKKKRKKSYKMSNYEWMNKSE